MKALKLLAIAAVIAVSAFTPRVAAEANTSIDIVASNWKFTPGTIQLHIGQVTTLRLTSSEGIHGLQSDELGIPQTTIAPGSAKTVTITPKKAGKYVLHCTVFCGNGHADMALTVNVVP